MSRPARGLGPREEKLPLSASASELRQLEKLNEDLRASQAARDEKCNRLAASLAVTQARQARAQRVFQLKKQKEQLMQRLRQAGAQVCARTIILIHLASLKEYTEAEHNEQKEKQREIISTANGKGTEKLKSKLETLRALQAQTQEMVYDSSQGLREQKAYRNLEVLRWRLVGNLKTVFPLGRGAEHDAAHTIAGLSLPNTDFTGCDEEEIAAALGCVAHVLILLGRWFDVPLRYAIVFLCSRSVILDEIAHASSPRFPLFSRGVDRARFEYGVYLLNKNLEQLLQSQGFIALNLKQTLPNLATFMNHQLRPAASVPAPLPSSGSLSVLPIASYTSSSGPNASPPLSNSLLRNSATTPPSGIVRPNRRDSPSRRSAPQTMMPAYSPPRKFTRPTGVSPSQNGGPPP